MKPLLMTRVLGVVVASLALVACSPAPRVPNWQLNAHGATERAVEAELEGLARIAQVEWARARAELARTAQPAAVARLELVRCAVRQAALDLVPCEGFDRLLPPDAPPAAAAERAYARYLAGHPGPADADALPPAHRPIARWLAQPAPAAADADVRLLQAVDDPLARLVGASVLLRAQRLSPAGLDLAVDTASAQGWRAPLLAWLGARLALAEAAGDLAMAERLRQRLALLAQSR